MALVTSCVWTSF